MARVGFRGKAGQSLQDWARTAAKLIEQLKQIETLDPTAGAALRADLPRLKELLERLITYYEGVPGETARFTQDADLLRNVAQITTERVAVIRALMSALDRLDSAER